MRNANREGVLPRTSLYDSFPVQFLYVPLHVQGTTASKVPVITNIADAPAEFTMTGTANYSGTKGYNTFNGSSWIISTDAAIVSFLGLAQDGQMFVNYRGIQPAAPGAMEYIWSVGLQANSNPYGGYGLALNTSLAHVQLFKRASQAVTTLSNATGTVTANTETQFSTFWDLKNLTVSNWRSGSSVNSNTLASNAAISIDPAVGLSIGVRNDVAAGTTPNPMVNTHTLGDILFVRSPDGVDLSSKIAGLVSALRGSKLEVPAYLRLMR